MSESSSPTVRLPVPGLFIAGTDTGVGKTQAACLIVRELREQGIAVAAYKPACSGAEVDADGRVFWSDLDRLAAALGLPTADDRVCRQRFLAPLAPPLAAAEEQRTVDVNAIDDGLLAACAAAEVVVVEGAGGWLCPFTTETTFADWVARWQMPVLVVARPGLGTINHTLLTLAAIRLQGLSPVGFLFNHTTSDLPDPSALTNAAEISRRSGVPYLGEIPHGEPTELRRDGTAVRMKWRDWIVAAQPEFGAGTAL